MVKINGDNATKIIIAVLLAVIIAGGGIISGYAQSRMTSLEEGQEDLKEKHAATVNKVDVIENEIGHIKAAVDETKVDVKEIKRLLMNRRGSP